MTKPNITNALLEEYDPDTFHYEKSYKIVLERILQVGTLDEWKEMLRVYSKDKILETISWSAQLPDRDKEFSRFFLQSDLLNVA